VRPLGVVGGVASVPPELEIVTGMVKELPWLREASMARALSACCPELKYAVLRMKLWLDEIEEPQRRPSR
jgi:hypothetical protein